MLKPNSLTKKLIEARNLYKNLGGNRVVENVSFTAKSGETLILLGTSGSGKTTTLKMLNRILEPDAGEVFIDSQPISTLNGPLLRRGIGYVLQDTGLFPHLTIGENIALVPKLLGWDRHRITLRSQALLKQFGLSGDRYYSSFPSSLSGGQKQRVGFVRALIASPPILLMDEPFGALDPITRALVRNDFRSLPELQDKCIIMVTHDIQEAFGLGDTILIMNEGKIEQIGSGKDLVLHPANNFVKQFLKNQNLNLQLQIRRLDLFYPQFFTDIPEGIPLEAISQMESLEKAFESFSPDQTMEILPVIGPGGERRYTHIVQLLSLLSLDME